MMVSYNQQQIVSHSPVEPVVSGEIWFGNTWPESSGRIDGTACVANGGQLDGKQCQANGDRSKWGGFVFLSSDHEDNKDKNTRAKRLDEDSLSDRRALRECSDDGERTGKHAFHQGRCNNATDDLGWDEKRNSQPGYVVSDTKCYRDLQSQQGLVVRRGLNLQQG